MTTDTDLTNVRGSFNIEKKCDVTDEHLEILLSCAFEGGSNYWIDSAEIVGDRRGTFFSEHVALGGELRIATQDDPDEYHTLTRLRLFDGFVRHCRKREMTPVELVEYSDADDGDCVLQYALFGEVIYG